MSTERNDDLGPSVDDAVISQKSEQQVDPETLKGPAEKKQNIRDHQDDDKNSEEAFREADAGDGTVREDQILTGSKLYICLFSLMLCLFLVAMDQTITMSSLSVISDKFHAFSKLTWITAAFVMPMGALLQVWGRLSISFGRKWVLMVGMVIFEIGSAISGAAKSMDMFIVGRAIQGCGASAVQGLVTIIASEITTIDKKPLMFTMISVTFAIASSVGPLIGGAFTQYVTWRWCFYINLCCFALIFPLFMLTYKPKNPVGTFKEKLLTVDYVSVFVMTAGILLVLLGISFGTTEGSYKHASSISCFCIGGVLCIAFFYFNHRSKYPVLPENIMFNLQIFLDFCVYSFSMGAMVVIFQFNSIYYQNVAGHNAFHTGASLVGVFLTISIASIFTGVSLQKFRYIKPFVVIGCAMVTGGIGMFWMLGVHESVAKSIGAQIIFGVGCGFAAQPPMMHCLIEAPKDPGSSILTTGYMNFGRALFTALFSLIGGEIYTATLRSQMPKVASELHTRTYSVDYLVNQLNIIQSLDSHDQYIVKTVLLSAIRRAYWLGIAMCIVSFVAACLTNNKRIPKKVEA